jgi:hypothetical protein
VLQLVTAYDALGAFCQVISISCIRVGTRGLGCGLALVAGRCPVLGARYHFSTRRRFVVRVIEITITIRTSPEWTSHHFASRLSPTSDSESPVLNTRLCRLIEFFAAEHQGV